MPSCPFIPRNELVERLLASRKQQKHDKAKKQPKSHVNLKNVVRQGSHCENTAQAEPGGKNVVLVPKEYYPAKVLVTIPAKKKKVTRMRAPEKQVRECGVRTIEGCLADAMFAAKWFAGDRCLVTWILRKYNVRATHRGLKAITEKQLATELRLVGCEVPKRCEIVAGKLGLAVVMTDKARLWVQIMLGEK